MSEKYYRDTIVDVDLAAIGHNYKAVSGMHPDKTFIAVIKANAYGLGSTAVAEYLSHIGVDFFAVGTLDEAVELRMHGIREKILILGPIRPEDMNKAIKHRIAVTAPSYEWLKRAEQAIEDDDGKGVWVHIKVNSGMNRLGVSNIKEVNQMIALIEASPYLTYEGLFSHLSSAEVDSERPFKEYGTFKSIISQVKKPQFVHVQNSAGAFHLEADECNAMRIGLSLYGYYPSDFIAGISPVELKPSVGLVTHVVDTHVLQEGEGVSYGLKYIADEKVTIATLPIGYADGFLRSRTGYKVALEDGTSCPVVGTVCMDYIMIRVPDHVELGDKVHIITPKRHSAQSMESYSDYVDTIPYESMCKLGRRLPRIYHGTDGSRISNEVLK
ncbi:alanine racemase [Salinicoccus siamensis]|uniref:Alanine racemase n=1 Tax=Salinicoccus siamensis TaxID=381830 RepID=A0ABV5Z423_9STAP